MIRTSCKPWVRQGPKSRHVVRLNTWKDRRQIVTMDLREKRIIKKDCCLVSCENASVINRRDGIMRNNAWGSLYKQALAEDRKGYAVNWVLEARKGYPAAVTSQRTSFGCLVTGCARCQSGTKTELRLELQPWRGHSQTSFRALVTVEKSTFKGRSCVYGGEAGGKIHGDEVVI